MIGDALKAFGMVAVVGLLAWVGVSAQFRQQKAAAKAAIREEMPKPPDAYQDTINLVLKCKPRRCRHVAAELLCYLPEDCPHYDSEATP